jgi:hypothetical protein
MARFSDSCRLKPPPRGCGPFGALHADVRLKFDFNISSGVVSETELDEGWSDLKLCCTS